jgi:3-deoxy-manno-octulosonate cytidylyltransferase (CMP-KDO synthetase)
MRDKPWIQHVLDRCRQATDPAAVVLCTDRAELQALATSWDFGVQSKSSHCTSGSDRIALVVPELVNLAWAGDASAAGPTTAAEMLNRTAVFNVQGDQPFIDTAVITAAPAHSTQRDPTPEVITPVYRL